MKLPAISMEKFQSFKLSGKIIVEILIEEERKRDRNKKKE
jgi:hypothetical protein